MNQHTPDTVVLLHGIFLNASSMFGMARFLRKQGYRVINLTYPSTRMTLEALAEDLHGRLAPQLPPQGRIHFVGHSMGGLLIRAYLAKHAPANLGRIVMLGTPNQGSEVADRIKDWKLYRRFYGPAGQQLLTTAPLTYPALPVGIIGMIAGTRSYDFIFGRFLPRPHDGKVSVASTRLDGMADHITLPVSHTYMPWSGKVQAQVKAFLAMGSFSRP